MTIIALLNNPIILCIILLLGAGSILLLIKYLTLKQAVYKIMETQNTANKDELKQYREQLYNDLNQNFKNPVLNVLHTLNELYEEENDIKKKEILEETIHKVKIIYHKLNTWPNRGAVKQDLEILERLKKEIHQYAEEKNPTGTISSVKTILTDSEENTNQDMIKNYLEKNLSGELFNQLLSSADEKLLKNIIDHVSENLENPELTVEGMSKKLGLSRNHLHRKLKSLTGQSPVEFIKAIRMSYAAHLLSTGKWSVSEVGYKVGYNTPSYFSSSFTAHFGMPPTTYMEKNTYPTTP